MQTFERLEHPVLQVSIGGSPVDKRPIYFRLITDKGIPSAVAQLRFVSDSGIGNKGDEVVVNLCYGGVEYLLFTGEIYDTAILGVTRFLALTDSYKKLCDTMVVAAYRKEMANIILQDTLGAAGISETAITCPAVEIARFSTQEIPAEKIIIDLIKALEEHGHAGTRFFFDEKDIFHFGTSQDTGKNSGETFAFETGKNIFKKGIRTIEVMPLPIRHTQDVTVDGDLFVTSRTDLYLSGCSSRLILWLEGAE